MISVKDVNDWENTLEFKDEWGDLFKKDNRARESLNKTLDVKFKAVYRKATCYKNGWKSDKIDLSDEKFFILTEKGKLVSMVNSEWSFLEKFSG